MILRLLPWVFLGFPWWPWLHSEPPFADQQTSGQGFPGVFQRKTCRFWPLCRGLHLFDLDRPRRPRRPWWPHECFRTSEPFQVRNGLCIFQVHFHIFSIRTQLDSKTWSEFSTIPQWPLCHNHKPTKVEPNLSSGAQLLLWSQIKLFFTN